MMRLRCAVVWVLEALNETLVEAHGVTVIVLTTGLVCTLVVWILEAAPKRDSRWDLIDALDGWL
ncbi:hypothetical protein KC19_1G307100 [Ceratodon purpureus]|uniref:Uncharacterized protein n=1 Tax=Ceratodon purpureus TaxID=3225 RepID=A0A8T0JCE4_CERPU|nr:hypothetical protein KC19_1G307100 [Ceratodon purpureus]